MWSLKWVTNNSAENGGFNSPTLAASQPRDSGVLRLGIREVPQMAQDLFPYGGVIIYGGIIVMGTHI